MHQRPVEPATYTIRQRDTLWQIARRFHTTVAEITAENPGLDADSLRVGQIIRIPGRPGPMPQQSPPAAVGGQTQKLSEQMRLLWMEHIFWTRLAILSTAFNLPDAGAVTARLLRNPKDFEAALKQYYGAEAAAKFADLLTDHLTIAAELVTAAKAGDTAAATDAERRWYENADEIAAFLGEINPYWSQREWRKMLYDHLSLTKDEAVDILTGNYEGSISVFENIEHQALAMADMMAGGIVKQFPQYFM
ncbi:hypothetical protein SDC9_52998 [bioreactor metagenome]|uniref:LysM domain-containing protein n=1 Tax=bioreactor metagenome TaxID=1076179 RepID=A0A644WS30_9ZZZZ